MARTFNTDHGQFELTVLHFNNDGSPGGLDATFKVLDIGTNVVDLLQPIGPNDYGNYTIAFDNGSYFYISYNYNHLGFTMKDRSNATIFNIDQYGSPNILTTYFYVFAYEDYSKICGTRAFFRDAYYTVMLHEGDTVQCRTSYDPYFKDYSLFFGGAEPLDDDPYGQGGNSTTGGGTGNFDGTSDTIGIPTMPTITGLNTGFFTAFTPTQTQLQNVSSYLWTNVIADILDINTGLKEKLDALKTIVANPYDAIMGCSLIPVAPTSGGSKELKMYGVVETGITLPYASSRWVDVDCGTLNVNEYWGAYLDYSPYTKTTSLYLPYIGTVSIDVDLIMGKALQIYYRVDILSGNCVAYILIDGSVKFSYQGNCAISIPITASDYSGAIHAGLGLVGSVANIVSSAVGGSAGGIGGAISGAVSSALSSAPSIAGNVMGMKPDIKSGGAVGGAAGFLGVQKPYLIIERPKQSLPRSQYKFTGYPLNMVKSVGDCSGYTEFDMILLDGITLTDAEKKELEGILTRGCYL